MANNSCRFKWTHCNTLPIYRAEHQWQATKHSTQAWQALCIRICQLQDTALWNISSYSKALEPQAVSRLSQGSEHRGPHPAPTTSLSTRRVIFEHCGWQVFPIESVRAPFPEPAISLRHRASSGAASRRPDGAGKLAELRPAAEITSQPEGCWKDSRAPQPHSRKYLSVNI